MASHCYIVVWMVVKVLLLVVLTKGGSAVGLPNPSTTISGIDYTTVCGATLMSYEAAITNCSSLGPGWLVASIPTQTVDEAFDSLTTRNIWLNARYNHNTNEDVWTVGRSAGVVFSTGLGGGTQCQKYCKWASGEPNGYSDCTGYPESYLVKHGVGGSVPDRRWNDLWDLTQTVVDACGIPSSSLVYCAACERSKCTMSDCPQSGGYRLKESYYPNCKCFTLSATLESTRTVNISTTSSLLSTLSIGSLSSSPSHTTTMNVTNTVNFTPTESIQNTATTSQLHSTTVSGASYTLSINHSATTSISMPTPSSTITRSLLSTLTTTISATTTTSLSTSLDTVSTSLEASLSSEITGGSSTHTTSLSTTVMSASQSSSHSDQPTCETLIPMVVFHYGISRYVISNTTCATLALQESPILPMQALWLGSAMDPTTNSSSSSQESVLTLRNRIIRGGRCPIIPPSPFAAVDIGHDSWSKNVIDIPIGGGALPTSTLLLPEGGIPPWVFNTVLPSTRDSIDSMITFTASNDGGGMQVPIVNPQNYFKVEVIAPPKRTQQPNNSTTTITTTASLIVRTTYIGPKSLNGFMITILLPSPLLVQCVGPQHVSLTLNLQTRTLLVDSASVADGVGTTVTASSGVTGSPGGIVRGGMLTSISSLLNCEAPSPYHSLLTPSTLRQGRRRGSTTAGVY